MYNECMILRFPLQSRSNTLTDPAGVQAIRNVRGNNTCVDCGAPSKLKSYDHTDGSTVVSC